MSSVSEKKLVASSVASTAEAADHGFNKSRQFESIVNLDQGDPTIYESYWRKVGDNFKVTISGHQYLSYFANPKNLCWFLLPELEKEIKILHKVAGNALVEDRHIVIGTGSSQLSQAALYALTDPLNEPNPISVVAAAPFYSTYKDIIDCVRSGLFKWAGDACGYDKDSPYVEIVTSPNNPDGLTREAVVNRAKGMVVHDLAYYWPQYTAITSPADHDIMLFTVSKCTGHAGSRIGWALVKDEEVAKRMVKFIVINTIGVSKEAQLRAASILEFISCSCQRVEPPMLDNFFEYTRLLMAERWKRLRYIVGKKDLFKLPEFPLRYCNFKKDFIEAYPAFAWIKGEEGSDCEKMLREQKVLTRSGRHFGCGVEYARLSMLSRDEEFEVFLQRLPIIMEEVVAPVQN